MTIKFTSYDDGGMITRDLISAGGISITEDENSITFDTSSLGGQLTKTALNALLESSDSSLTIAVSGSLVNLEINSVAASKLTGQVSTAHGGTGSALFSAGSATFATAGSVDVADATITSSSKIVVTEAGAGSSDTYAVVVDAGVKFTINSSNSSSAATVNYIRVG